MPTSKSQIKKVTFSSQYFYESQKDFSNCKNQTQDIHPANHEPDCDKARFQTRISDQLFHRIGNKQEFRVSLII